MANYTGRMFDAGAECDNLEKHYKDVIGWQGREDNRQHPNLLRTQEQGQRRGHHGEVQASVPDE
eukprot:2258832-Pyramimonas_sp.AAC.1